MTTTEPLEAVGPVRCSGNFWGEGYNTSYEKYAIWAAEEYDALVTKVVDFNGQKLLTFLAAGLFVMSIFLWSGILPATDPDNFPEGFIDGFADAVVIFNHQQSAGGYGSGHGDHAGRCRDSSSLTLRTALVE